MDITTKAGISQPNAQGAVNEKLFSDLFGALKVTELGQRFYELNKQGILFSTSIQDTALVSLNATGSGLTATAKPIVGVFNPVGSGVDLVLLKTFLGVSTIANSAVNPGGFCYVAGSAGVNPISTGVLTGIINLKSLLNAGSQAQQLNGAVLTGLVGNAVIVKQVEVSPVLNAAGNATAVSFANGVVTEMLEGAIIVKQGQFLGIMNKLSTTTVDVTAGLVWAELPTVSGS